MSARPDGLPPPTIEAVLLRWLRPGGLRFSLAPAVVALVGPTLAYTLIPFNGEVLT